MDARTKHNLAIAIMELHQNVEALNKAQAEVSGYFHGKEPCAVVLTDRQFIALHGFYVLALDLLLGGKELDTREMREEVLKVKADLEAKAAINKARKGDDNA